MHRLKTSVNREGESKGIWRIKCLRLWMSQSWFFLGFLSQNSLWKLSTFHGYKGIYSRVREECEKSFFYKIGHSSNSLSSGMSCELTARPDCQFLSCSALAVVTLQLSTCFACVAFWQVASRKSLARSSIENPLNAHLNSSHSSHTQPLHYSHLNTRYLIAKLQANLAQNKANT